MLEGLVAWVLNNYLGKYVENLNTDQLSVALLSGKVELENLPLKKDALRHLGLPVEIKAGFIGKVQLHVPVRQIRSAPWVIAIEKLYLVAAPVNLDEWDSDVEAAIAHEYKVSLLDALEAQWRAEHEAADAGYYAASYSSWLSYGTGLLANIVENLQLNLKDVHIRYEDALTCPGRAFACGLVAEALAAESCDAAWNRGGTAPGEEPCSFKLLELANLALYWDPMVVPAGMMADCTIAELTERMRETWSGAHRWLMRPGSASARVRRERCERPLRDRARPRLACHLTLDSVLLRLTDRQYSEMAGCRSGLERVARLRVVRALRPRAPLQGHARAWWLYAVKAHLPHHTWMDPRPSWEDCVSAAREARRYVSLVLQTLLAPAATLPPDDQRVKDDYEWRQPIHVLKPLREVAMRKVPASTPVTTPDPASSGRSVLVRWFPQWWGWYASPNTTAESQSTTTTTDATTFVPHPTSTVTDTTTSRLEDEILDVIADSLDDNTMLKRDAAFGLFEFTLQRGSLDICIEGDKDDSADGGAASEGLELQFSSVLMRVETRPRAAAHALHASLGAVVLRDRVTPETLFPVLVAPQGMIREGLSAMNAAASAAAWWRAQRPPPIPHAPPNAPPPSAEPLFQLFYEKRPSGPGCDYRLRVKSRSVEVVWAVGVARWARRWVAAGGALASVRSHTRATLHHHWDRLVHHARTSSERRSWQIELDVSAPQILLVEELCDRDASVLLLDFGRLRLANAPPLDQEHRYDDMPKQFSADDDEELFMTPCSTPPGSPLSPASPGPPLAPPLRAADLHPRLYDRYCVELSELQVLVGRARDNWRYAHNKTTSALHLLDRFTISLQAERRVVSTTDPQYPRVALAGSLPALVVHLSEHKLAAVRAVVASVRPDASPGVYADPIPNQEGSGEEESQSNDETETEQSEVSTNQNATILMLQFAIDQMSLEVQSRGRSIAEVQVCGVRAALALRPADTSLSLSVHSLLLVDALQTYGPDFELLLASHKHLGMDTASGSIRGSEPTSPTSPASPPARSPPPPPTPRQLHRALHSLRRKNDIADDRTDREAGTAAPDWVSGVSWHSVNTSFAASDFAWGSFGQTDWGGMGKEGRGGGGWGQEGSNWGASGGWAAPGLVDSEALIAVELCFVKGEGESEDLQIANILFNNLDVIANQETIVELIGFAHRVSGPAPPPPRAPPAPAPHAHTDHSDARPVRTEITFDFHRLGVLLLRAGVRDGVLVAGKIATATVGDARIQATLDGDRIEVGGSLGGVQVVSLSDSAGVHSRVLTAGRAPAPPSAPMAPVSPLPSVREPQHPQAEYNTGDEKALLFSISRTIREPDVVSSAPDAEGETEGASRSLEVCVWVRVARVWYTHSPPLLCELRECVAQFQQYLANLGRSIRAAAADMAIGLVQPRGDSIYANPRLSQSTEGVSPRRRTASAGCSLDEPDLEPSDIILNVNVELQSPVVVLPRAARSPHVLVAHLGRMALTQRGPAASATAAVRVRDISLVSLDVGDKVRKQLLATDNMADIYDVTRGRPVLHDTGLRLRLAPGSPWALDGAVVGGLHVSASREQYEQLLDTLHWLSVSPPLPSEPAPAAPPPLEPVAVPTLRLDPQLRAAVLAVPKPAPHDRPAHTPLVVTFELPNFTVELRADLGTGERSLVSLTFREFLLRREHLHPHESILQVSLHSITMEDLTKEPESRHRMLMVSHTPPGPPKAVFVSKSCPDFVTEFPDDDSACPLQQARAASTSLPTALNLSDREYKRILENERQARRCGPTPPCSPEHDGRSGDDALEGPAQDNLVWVSVHSRHPQHPQYRDQYKEVSRSTKVDFNCLKLVLSIDSWVTVLDFFGVAGDEPDLSPPTTNVNETSSSMTESTETGITETEMSVRSLSVLVVGARGEACRALVSRVSVRVREGGAGGGRNVHARLGELALADLTPHAPLWRERLSMRTKHALDIHYQRLNATEAVAAGHEAYLSLEMGPVTYVHTRRFVLELQSFARDFSLLRRVIAQARRKVSSGPRDASLQRLRLRLRCSAPVIVLPVSGRSRDALAAELQQLLLDNCFRRAGHPDTVSKIVDPTIEEREMLDVRTIRVEGLTLWCARVGDGCSTGAERVRRIGEPLLPAPASLSLQLEHNCSDTHNVPEMTVQGRLATLQVALDAAQYRLVRGVLAHNLAEACPEVLAPAAAGQPFPSAAWPTWSLRLDLQDVSLELLAVRPQPPLACINFIKSRLIIETHSDLSQDIDLVSQEILVSDTRFASQPANRRGNVFSHIVQPLPDHRHSVQAEVHARKRPDSSAYTIMVNNMRLMAILDWWEAAAQFLAQAPPPPSDPDLAHLDALLENESEWCSSGGRSREGGGAGGMQGASHVELKLNVTDSQLVFVEDASLWDTNAVILKSTTVITYRPADEARPVVCELNELEVFSCVLGLEEETALSIVEPAAVTASLQPGRVLAVSAPALRLRLSYHDMRMFASMLQSLPAQARAALSGKVEEDGATDVPANSVHMGAGVSATGPVGGAARNAVCAAALPLWARPPPPQPPPPAPPALWPLRAVQVSAECVTLCVIDDCLDSDVPLLEVSLVDLELEQDLRKVEESFEDPLLVCTPVGATGASEARGGAGGGRLRAQLSADYYNRTLSDWEPVVEPWSFEAGWEHTLSRGLALGRLQLYVRSDATLDTNLTSSLVDLACLVRTNWTQDYYAPQTISSEQSPKGSPSGHRRRSPFVPYALRNLTGQRLWFTTLTTTSDELRESGELEVRPDDSWVMVRAGDTEPFSFGARRGRVRTAPTPAPAGPAPLHRLVLRIDGWAPPDPICVDRVGVFFRQITHTKTGAEARVVLEVSLEGSARKLVAVRSALQVVNKLPHPVEMRLDRAPTAGAWSGVSVSGAKTRATAVDAGARWAAPLEAYTGVVWVRPLAGARAPPAPPLPPAAVNWRAAAAERALMHHECRAPHDHSYRFCCVVVRERFPPDRGEPLAGHTLTLVPALRLENLLPLELHYRTDAVTGTIAPAQTQPFHQVNVEEGVEMSVKLEGFGWSTPLSLGGNNNTGSFSARLKLRDRRGRRLYLNARVTIKKTDGIKVCLSAAYWLVNRTGLPLVFRAEGGGEAAGQFAEHELARMVAPLPFAFADGDGPTLAARLGTSLAPNPEWCSPFGLGPGVTVKRLECRGGGAGGGAGADSDRSYAVGVAVRAGRGRYRRTNIVTFTPRYQLHNNTSHCLQFAQKCSATTLNDPGARSTHVSAVAGCHLPWHWARWDRERLLCVRVLDAGGAPRTSWSGGFKLDEARGLHVACRGGAGAYELLRVEVVAQGAALLVVLTDADRAPPPLRIDNHSPVAIMFHQVGCSEECVVGAGGRALWALPEPEGTPALALRAPGGPRLTLPLHALHEVQTLLYQNFIYVAFYAQETNAPDTVTEQTEGAEEGVLVLEVPLGSTRVQLARMRYGDRCQLWRRGPGGQLVHEGSSPPQPTDQLAADTMLSPHALVLDIEEAAPRPARAAALVLRRSDPRRASTQTWRLLANAMCCAHNNLSVQPEDGLMGLNAGARVVLGLAGSTRAPVVRWPTLRPGSGRLSVTLCADGPTRRVRIVDQVNQNIKLLDDLEEEEEEREAAGAGGAVEWEVSVSLAALSLSLVARRPPAELLYAHFSGVRLRAAREPRTAQLALTVGSMQWDNQLVNTPSPVLLYVLGDREAELPSGVGSLPALHASLELARAPPRHYNALYFNHFVVALRPLAVRLDERLILLLWSWVEGGAGSEDGAAESEEPDEAEYETRRVLHELTALHATRYYFALIKIIPSQIRLSMFTANKLESELSALKRQLGLTLVRFEDAAVELEPFARAHAFDTAAAIARHLLQHFKDELKWQAAKILGSVDFLGNPLGFVADVSEGVSGLLLEGNVRALFKNVTHGISNSAAKVTETLGDGLERVVADEAHEETRRRIRSGAAGAHLAAGLRGLGLGLLGGLTSLAKHSYEGAASEGVAGFLAGVGKGLVGTVTKPVIGVLDLATETAAAVRDSARRGVGVPTRARAPRLAAAGAPLPRYCGALAAGAALLLALPQRDAPERFLAYRIVRDSPHDIRALLSDSHLRIITCKHAAPQVVMETHLSNLVSCTAVCADGAWFVELGVRGAGGGGGGGGAGSAGESLRRPRVQCDTHAVAAWLARHAAAARQLYHDRTHTLLPHGDL